MIFTTCSRCHKRIAVGKRCDCYERRRKAERPQCDSFYLSREWQTARRKAIARTYCLDIYSLYIDGKIEQGRTVHHIVPLEEDYTKRTERGNLIYLTEEHHRMIHEQYQKGKKRELIAQLRALLKRFDEEFGAASE